MPSIYNLRNSDNRPQQMTSYDAMPDQSELDISEPLEELGKRHESADLSESLETLVRKPVPVPNPPAAQTREEEPSKLLVSEQYDLRFSQFVGSSVSVPDPVQPQASPPPGQASPPPALLRSSYSPEHEVGSSDSESSEEADEIPIPIIEHPQLNWTLRFQEITQNLTKLPTATPLNQRVENTAALKRMQQDFLYLAKICGRMIISEVYLPDAQKTIKPIDIGGVAGGSKYIAQGILFKFPSNTANIYASYEGAAKVAGHEFKGMVACYNCSEPDVNFPFIALIDYRGFRLVCMSLLPINSTTLCCGSRDAGATVYSDPELSPKIQRICTALNLAEHVVSSNGIRTRAPLDLEGHRGTDGRFYLLDFARVLPPEALRANDEKGAFLFKLLRPELVKAFPKPLCPDAFSAFLKFEPQRKELNATIVHATWFLKNEVIPSAANLYATLSEDELATLPLTNFLHNYGINIRYLGLFTKCIPENAPGRKLCLIEMTARVFKHSMRRAMREEMKGYKLPQDGMARDTITKAFNSLFSSLSKLKENSWLALEKEIQTRFEFQTPVSLRSWFEENPSAKKTLFHYSSEILGVVWCRATCDNLEAYFTKPTPFGEADLEELGLVVHALPLISFSEAYILKNKVREDAKNPELSRFWGDKALQEFNKALQQNYNDRDLLLQKASLLGLVKQVVPMRSLYKSLIFRSKGDPKVFLAYALSLELVGEVREAEENFWFALQAKSDYVEALENLARFLRQLPSAQNLASRLEEICATVRAAQAVKISEKEASLVATYVARTRTSSTRAPTVTAPPPTPTPPPAQPAEALEASQEIDRPHRGLRALMGIKTEKRDSKKSASAAAPIPNPPPVKAPPPQYEYLAKALLIGDSGSGKSALLLRYADNTYTDSFISTIGTDFKVKDTVISGHSVRLQVWDTAGQERFRTITSSYYRGAQIIMVTLDLTDPSAYHSAQHWLQEVERYAHESTTRVLVATKSDLVDERKLDAGELREYADNLGIPLIETSAKNSTNVEEAFLLGATEFLEKILSDDTPSPQAATIEAPKKEKKARFRRDKK